VTVLEIDGVSKTYGSGADAFVAIDEVTFTTRPGEMLCIVGPSGCGKTTLLRCVSGLLRTTAGAVLLDERTVRAPPRSMALVFQDYSRSLLPWMRVHDNVVLPLKAARVDRAERDRLAREALAAVGLSGHGRKYPWQLSGGMQQRAAIARALVHDAKLLLMDEPFGALDAMTREQMNLELQRIWAAQRKTVVFITHSIAEAVFLADRVVVMSPRPGRVLEVIANPMPRMRSLDDTLKPEFGELVRRVRLLLGGQGVAL
jgi:NitT/TauT family transport system ATP-binding protein